MKCYDTFSNTFILTAVRMLSIVCLYYCCCCCYYKVIFTAVRRRQSHSGCITAFPTAWRTFLIICVKEHLSHWDKVPWMNFYVGLKLFYCCTLRRLCGAAILTWLCTFLLNKFVDIFWQDGDVELGRSKLFFIRDPGSADGALCITLILLWLLLMVMFITEDVSLNQVWSMCFITDTN